MLGGVCVYAAASAGRLAPIALVTGALAVGLLALGIVVRWPSMIPWTIVLAAAGYLAARQGTELVDGWAAAIGVLLLLAAEPRRGRSSTTRGFAASRHSPSGVPPRSPPSASVRCS